MKFKAAIVAAVTMSLTTLGGANALTITVGGSNPSSTSPQCNIVTPPDQKVVIINGTINCSTTTNGNVTNCTGNCTTGTFVPRPPRPPRPTTGRP
jgi:hypothetical protein